MEGHVGDRGGIWVAAVGSPAPWRSVLWEVALTLGVPLLEAEPDGRGAEVAEAPLAVIVFADAAVRDRGVVARAKAAWPRVPMLVLLRGGSERALLDVLESGADDVLRLPVTGSELAERVRATVRRLGEEMRFPLVPDKQSLQLGGALVDGGARRVRRGDRALPLTDAEFQLLAMMAAGAGRAFSRERLLRGICGFTYQIDSRAIDVHIRNLRRKVESDPSHPAVIQSVPGVGYLVAETQDRGVKGGGGT